MFWFYSQFNDESKWERVGQGAIFASINGDDIRGFPVDIPTLEEQNSIASMLMHLDAKIGKIATQCSYMKTFKQGLLQKMFV